MFAHAGLPAFLPDFLVGAMDPLELGGGDPRVLASFPESPGVLSHRMLPSRPLERPKVCSSEVQACELAFHPPPCPRDPELHHLTGTATKAAFDLCVPNKPLVVGECCPANRLSSLANVSLEKEVISEFQEPPR